MKKRGSLLITLILFFSSLLAKQGMWPPFLISHCIDEMKEMGFELEADDLFHPDSAALNHAVVHFGGGCTGVIISPEGLLATNFHCSHRQVQALSSLENNYLANGFWAPNHERELPVPELSVKITTQMEDVTRKVLSGTDSICDERERFTKIRTNITEIELKANISMGNKAEVKAFYQGNQYFLVKTEEFKDIRLVGVPPESIGRFGGDTDNWVWPRHTGDFSLFRIYAANDNQPSDYSPGNVPYRPKRFIPINISGLSEGDFTMVYGFSGLTQSYLPSAAIDMYVNYVYPNRVAIREIKIGLINQATRSDSVAAFRYSASLASLSNAWKKWKGEIIGLNQSNALGQKKKQELEFIQWVNNEESRIAAYGSVLSRFDSLYKQYLPFQLAFDCFTESIFRGQDSYLLFLELDKLGKADTIVPVFKNEVYDKLFDNHTEEVEKPAFVELMHYYSGYLPEIFKQDFLPGNGLVTSTANAWESLYNASILTNMERLNELKWIARNKTLNPKIEKDELFKYYSILRNHFNANILPRYYELKDQISKVQTQYTKALIEMAQPEALFPDANSTLRFSFGKVEGYRPADGIEYRYYTTLEGKMDKVSPEIYDYQVPEKLKALFEKKDYGRYADNDGRIRTCFIASNHTTGGNSGSPVLNARGELVGLNFDRCWEGTMSDLWYNPLICRNIALDIRYMLFLIEQHAGAGHLLQEMSIVE